ncbi:MAG: family 65 glycosyl hydrolase [Oscillospiraceae bacterium]|nr:family 65 glycosyl hydrolase [Oscillospiraceae bacterium]MCL2279785.1 family 65 glycosyl hydrolase [Oscillospiraceae bacterium]
MAKVADKYFVSDPWKVIEKGFDPAYSRVSESIFALSNENIGVRGNFDEGGSVDSLRGSYVNGVYEITQLNKSYRGIIDKTHFMIPAVDWLNTTISLDGEVLDLGKVKFSDFSRELDLRAGTLTRSFIWHTAGGKNLKLTFIRFMDMTNNERAYQRFIFRPLNFSGELELTMALSFDMVHEGRDACFWGDTVRSVQGNSMSIMSRTKVSGKEVFAGAYVDAQAVLSEVLSDRLVSLYTKLKLTKDTPVTVDKKVVVVFDDSNGDALLKKGSKLMSETENVSFDTALAAAKAYWEAHWALSDVVIESADSDNDEAVADEQQGIRFCIFQMAQTYNGGSVLHNIGAKGLTGEAYNGHAFWDSEACCLPFYLFTNPGAAKTLLMFRYNTLPQALERAKMLDCTGACYPLATLNGDEACDLWQHASLQLQPSTAVSYGIWHYEKVTRDEDFLWQYGAEMLTQIARFLVSRVNISTLTGKYGYYGVMGPDEFHMMVNNNAYTNYMGKRSLEYAAEVVNRMKSISHECYETLVAKTGLICDEILHWEKVAENMALPMTEDGLIEQFDGYFDFPYLDINSIPVSEFPLYGHWSYDRLYRTSLIKQPDVLMFLYLYNSSFSEEIKRINYDYYEPRTIHESSLSPAVHSILAAELGKMDEATKFFGFVTRLDLDNYNRNTREGLHTTSIAMAWINIIYGFAGLRSDDDVLHFAPRLPPRWKTLTFSLVWMGRNVRVKIGTNETVFTLLRGEPMDMLVYGKKVTLGNDAFVISR